MVTNNAYQPMGNMGYNPMTGSIAQPRYTYPTNYNMMNPSQAVNSFQPNYTAQPQQSSIFGRIVNDENEIMPNEVPMDGTIGIFPKSDGSEVIVKSWTQNGTISTVKYVPVVEGETPQVSNDPYPEIIDRLDRIEKQLSTRRTNRNNSYKKETSNDSEH